MNKKKIFNDPVYGFIAIPYEIIFDLIEHPYFQRLRRIKQLGLTHYVYPGALHTRFHHALGAMHLMTQAIEVLRSKGVDITREEAEGATIAILLHDIGHGPFSHALEHTIIDVTHEELSLLFLKRLNILFEGKLDLAIDIFQNNYGKRFLYQLISGQLDMDRMDYLNRDSFFTGVSEGVIGYHRIIKMLNVYNGELVVEEKGLFSIEKFLVSRRLMYWQVYLHKTVLSAEQMLIKMLLRLKELFDNGQRSGIHDTLSHFFKNKFDKTSFLDNEFDVLNLFAKLDDYDVFTAIKNNIENSDFTLSYLSKGLLNRKLFKIEMQNEPFSEKYKRRIEENVRRYFAKEKVEIEYLVFDGVESISNYSTKGEEIKILLKGGKVLPMSSCADHGIIPRRIEKHYLCYPKINLSEK